MLSNLFRRNKRSPHAPFLYGVVVAHAREPLLYARLGLPDTFDGRFEALAMHLYLLNRMLREGDGGPAISQDVFDLFIDDMDSALREAGVGDQTVPKRLAKMTRVVHGRVAAYDRALEAEDGHAAVQEVLERNVSADEGRRVDHAALTRYFFEQLDHTSHADFQRVLNEQTDPFRQMSADHHV